MSTHTTGAGTHKAGTGTHTSGTSTQKAGTGIGEQEREINHALGVAPALPDCRYFQLQ